MYPHQMFGKYMNKTNINKVKVSATAEFVCQYAIVKQSSAA